MMKRFSVLFMVMFTLVLSGCTSKFAYNNIDWMLYWYVDDYIDLNKQQKNLLDVRIEEWHKWHRTTELAQYKQQLLDLKSQLEAGPLSAEQWIEQLEQGSKHWERFRDHISPELTALAVNLTDEQIIELFETLEKDNLKEIEERNEDTEAERWEDSRKRSQKQFKNMIGRLTNEQKEIINTEIDNIQSTFDFWIEYRRASQAQAKSILLQRNELEDFAQQLQAVMANPDQFRSDAHIAANQHNRQVFAGLLAKINATLTKKQKRRMFNEIDDLVDDITDLIED